MASTFTTITTELMEHADGRLVGYIDATVIAVFTYQQPDGSYVIDIYTRDDIACGRLRLLLDGEPLPGTRQREYESQRQLLRTRCQSAVSPSSEPPLSTTVHVDTNTPRP